MLIRFIIFEPNHPWGDSLAHRSSTYEHAVALQSERIGCVRIARLAATILDERIAVNWVVHNLVVFN